MAKKIFRLLNRYSYVATGFRKVAIFLQNHPKVVDTIREIPFVDGLGILLYIGILSYLWYDYIKSNIVTI